MKKAFITGITGQDGSYLAELLLSKDYEVHGLVRRASTHGTLERINHIKDKLILHVGDLTDANVISNIIQEIQPDEVYNLAAQSHVGESFKQPLYTSQVDAIGVLHVLEAIRTKCPTAKFYQASTSELFGKVQETPQTETTPFYPRSPYGAAKLASLWYTRNYRESYNLFTCNGILFNHTGPRRGQEFVTRKITLGIRDILRGDLEFISIGNMDAKRDWGHAKDYVEGMWRMLQADKPDDYVLASGETHSVREFFEIAFRIAGIEIEWVGSGVDEVGIDKETEKVLVVVDPQFYRPCEVDLLLGDPSKAERELGWTREYDFESLVEEMVLGDLG